MARSVLSGPLRRGAPHRRIAAGLPVLWAATGVAAAVNPFAAVAVAFAPIVGLLVAHHLVYVIGLPLTVNAIANMDVINVAPAVRWSLLIIGASCYGTAAVARRRSSGPTLEPSVRWALLVGWTLAAVSSFFANHSQSVGRVLLLGLMWSAAAAAAGYAGDDAYDRLFAVALILPLFLGVFGAIFADRLGVEVMFPSGFKGLFANPNGLGLVAGMVLVWLWHRRKMLYRFVTGVALFGVVVSQSRAAWLGVLAALLFVRASQLHLTTRVVLVALGGVASAWAMTEGPVMDASGSSGLSALPVESRTEAWRAALAQTPLLRPRGFGTTDVTDAISSFDLRVAFSGLHLHNSYIEILFELGYVLGISFLIILWYLLKKSYRNSVDINTRAVIVFGAVHAMFESWMFLGGSLVAFAYWILVLRGASSSPVPTGWSLFSRGR